MDLGISNRTALVTAASKGLGRACARALAGEGCNVVMSSRGGAGLDEAARAIASATGARVEAVAADVAREADLERLAEAAAGHFGGVDILVTNTGGPPPGTFGQIDDGQWQAGFESTLLNVVRLCRLCVPRMRDQGWGRVVNITSVSVQEPIANLVVSNAVRAAVHGLAKTLATEVGGSGVTVNCVCPGLHLTDRLRELAEIRAEGSGGTVEAALDAMAASIPVGRLGDPDEFAKVVAFLCSEPAGFVTGTSVLVDGGATQGVT